MELLRADATQCQPEQSCTLLSPLTVIDLAGCNCLHETMTFKPAFTVTFVYCFVTNFYPWFKYSDEAKLVRKA